MRGVGLLPLALPAAIFAASIGFAEQTSFKARLSPKEEVAIVDSKSSGKAQFRVSVDGKALAYKLYVKRIADVSATQIHIGKKGQIGPPIAGLLSGGKKGEISGVLCEGKIVGEDLMGEYKGRFDELVELIRSGGAYVNVHTAAYPDGELRGQIE